MNDFNNTDTYAKHVIKKIGLLIVKYAENKDVKKLIINCYETIRLDLMAKRLNEYNEEIDYWKEELIDLLTFDFLIDEFDDSDIFEDVKHLLKLTLFTHLKCIARCFYSYSFLMDVDKSSDTDKKFIEKLDNENIDVKSMFTADSLKKFEITNILHDIISCYDNKFYYMFDCDSVSKIEIAYKQSKKGFEEVITNIIRYELINKDRKPSIIDNETGLKIPIDRQVKPLFQDKKNKVKMQPNTYDSFMGTHDRLVKALSLHIPACHWCNPDISKKNEKGKCNTCQKLLDDLNKFVHENELENINFNTFVDSIRINDVTNLAELKKKRRELLYSYLKKAEKQIKFENKEAIMNLKMLVDTSFSEFAI